MKYGPEDLKTVSDELLDDLYLSQQDRERIVQRCIVSGSAKNAAGRLRIKAWPIYTFAGAAAACALCVLVFSSSFGGASGQTPRTSSLENRGAAITAASPTADPQASGALILASATPGGGFLSASSVQSSGAENTLSGTDPVSSPSASGDTETQKENDSSGQTGADKKAPASSGEGLQGASSGAPDPSEIALATPASSTEPYSGYVANADVPVIPDGAVYEYGDYQMICDESDFYGLITSDGVYVIEPEYEYGYILDGYAYFFSGDAQAFALKLIDR